MRADAAPVGDAAGADDDATGSGSRRTLVQVGGAIAVATFTVTLSVTSVAVAVPTLTRALGTSTLESSLVVVVPPLVSTVFLLPSGRVSDLLGRRRCYLIALTLFTIAAVAMSLADDVRLIIALQIVQAVAVAAIWANSAALLLVSLPERHFRIALGCYIGAISVADLAGPTVGGVITDAFGWRWIFGLTAVVGAACTAWSWFALPVATRDTSDTGFDVTGAVLLVAGLTGVVGSLLAVQSSGRIGAVASTALVLGVVALVVLRRVERRQRHPMLDLRMFAGRALRVAIGSGVFNAAAQWAPSLLLVLFFQAHDGQNAALAGLRTMPLTVAAALSSAAMGALSARVSTRRLALLGSSLGALGLLGITVGLDRSGPVLDVALVLLGVGSGIFSPALADVLIRGNATSAAGAVNGARLTAQNLGWVIAMPLGLAITTAWLEPAQRRSFFAGQLRTLSPHADHLLLDGSRWAFVCLTGFAVVGTALAWVMVRTGADRHRAVSRGTSASSRLV